MYAETQHCCKGVVHLFAEQRSVLLSYHRFRISLCFILSLEPIPCFFPSASSLSLSDSLLPTLDTSSSVHLPLSPSIIPSVIHSRPVTRGGSGGSYEPPHRITRSRPTGGAHNMGRICIPEKKSLKCCIDRRFVHVGKTNTFANFGL